MATLIVNKPGAGLDSGRQGSRGTAVVKVRDLACSVLHHRPPFGSSLRSGGRAPAVFFGPLRASRLYKPCRALRDFYLCGIEVAWFSAHTSPLRGQWGHL